MALARLCGARSCSTRAGARGHRPRCGSPPAAAMHHRRCRHCRCCRRLRPRDGAIHKVCSSEGVGAATGGSEMAPPFTPANVRGQQGMGAFVLGPELEHGHRHAGGCARPRGALRSVTAFAGAPPTRVQMATSWSEGLASGLVIRPVWRVRSASLPILGRGCLRQQVVLAPIINRCLLPGSSS